VSHGDHPVSGEAGEAIRSVTSPRGWRSTAARGLSPLAGLVRRHDPDRFQTALFAPAERRGALFALYAFNCEIARVRERVTTPVLGQIRLQWWREAVAAAFAGGPVRRHEVAEPLTAAIRAHGLDRAPFERLIDAREADLDDAPPPSLKALEAYAEASSAPLVFLALAVLDVHEAAAIEAGRRVGIGYALAGLLRAMPLRARAGRPLIPPDLAEQTGFDPRDWQALRTTPALRAATAEIAAVAARHLAAARAVRSAVPRRAVPALLPAIVAERALRRLARADHDPFDPRLLAPDPAQIWSLAWAAVLRRY
jgi:NADH dehydrogenase [ubiquinone] 1 alpha subcomplex assembly factor 6